MSIRRRTFLTAGTAAALTSGAGTALGAAPPPATAQAGPFYPAHRAPLRPAAFLRLPPGAVRARGWLATQLDKQLDGLNGRLQEVSHFLRFDATGWVRPELGGWEEVPYWLRGYGDLGYVTGDARVLGDTQRWVEAVLATQAADGFFGPSALRGSLNGHADLWPHMPMLHALRSWAEFHDDTRVDRALTRFFAFTARQPDAVFADGWGATRWGDTIDVVLWLYNRTGDTALLDLTRRIHRFSASWTGDLPTLHNVNIAQGFREPAQFSVLSGDDADRAAAYRNYDTVMRRYGQFPGGGFAGDENARPGYGDPRQGFETCGVVEYMGSHELLTRLTGDAVWADRTEDLAFNLLPASLDPAGRVAHYVTPANAVRLDDVPKRRRQFQNGFAMLAYQPGVDQYRCCPHNYGQGWPYFVEEMWLATADGGVVAALYGPSAVTVKVGDGTAVTITEDTAYPFGDTIRFRVATPRPLSFPFAVRVPGWCADPVLTVNGAAVAVQGGPRYATVTRTWSDGDTLVLRLPMAPRTRTWPDNHGAVSVEYGALAFSLRVEERWTRYGGTEAWPAYEVAAGSPWNVGLVPGRPMSVTTGGDVDDPFTLGTAPIRITAKAQDIPDWTADGEDVVATMSDSPVATGAPVRDVTLIPAGAARLRITSFPLTGGSRGWGTPGVVLRVQNKNSGKVLAVDGASTANSARVVQFADVGTADHAWRLVDQGNGRVKVRNENSGRVLGVDGMSTANSAQVVQFDDNGTRDHLWDLVDDGDGWFRLRNAHSGRVLGVDLMSTADSARVVQYDDNGTADHLWRVVPDGPVKIQNLNSTKVLAVAGTSTADSARVVQFGDTGTADHRWQFVPDTDGCFRIRNAHSGKVLGVDRMSTADSAIVVQFADNGTADHRWRLRAGTDGLWRVQNANSGKVLGVDGMSHADSAQVVQFGDTGTPDHLWRLLPG
ncbi:RICIN domain-containing protein [Saccharothrix sp. 6-C]|uniref:RICIN domain-containing protein n=1 Tax=Saccharothrix sp. 6-C TaxID=2781735 RepID=UPI00191767D5|nr:RICIN domain-containing protein [Saccharothrix sp. 6-C]QQQ73556.1 RICIN domain-containing protein [Saccharothrix sp. 6-C]